MSDSSESSRLSTGSLGNDADGQPSAISREDIAFSSVHTGTPKDLDLQRAEDILEGGGVAESSTDVERAAPIYDARPVDPSAPANMGDADIGPSEASAGTSAAGTAEALSVGGPGGAGFADTTGPAETMTLDGGNVAGQGPGSGVTYTGVSAPVPPADAPTAGSIYDTVTAEFDPAVTKPVWPAPDVETAGDAGADVEDGIDTVGSETDVIDFGEPPADGPIADGPGGGEIDGSDSGGASTPGPVADDTAKEVETPVAIETPSDGGGFDTPRPDSGDTSGDGSRDETESDGKVGSPSTDEGAATDSMDVGVADGSEPVSAVPAEEVDGSTEVSASDAEPDDGDNAGIPAADGGAGSEPAAEYTFGDDLKGATAGNDVSEDGDRPVTPETVLDEQSVPAMEDPAEISGDPAETPIVDEAPDDVAADDSADEVDGDDSEAETDGSRLDGGDTAETLSAEEASGEGNAGGDQPVDTADASIGTDTETDGSTGDGGNAEGPSDADGPVGETTANASGAGSEDVLAERSDGTNGTNGDDGNVTGTPVAGSETGENETVDTPETEGDTGPDAVTGGNADGEDTEVSVDGETDGGGDAPDETGTDDAGQPLASDGSGSDPEKSGEAGAGETADSAGDAGAFVPDTPAVEPGTVDEPDTDPAVDIAAEGSGTDTEETNDAPTVDDTDPVSDVDGQEGTSTGEDDAVDRGSQATDEGSNVETVTDGFAAPITEGFEDDAGSADPVADHPAQAETDTDAAGDDTDTTAGRTDEESIVSDGNADQGGTQDGGDDDDVEPVAESGSPLADTDTPAEQDAGDAGDAGAVDAGTEETPVEDTSTGDESETPGGAAGDVFGEDDAIDPGKSNLDAADGDTDTGESPTDDGADGVPDADVANGGATGPDDAPVDTAEDADGPSDAGADATGGGRSPDVTVGAETDGEIQGGPAPVTDGPAPDTPTAGADASDGGDAVSHDGSADAATDDGSVGSGAEDENGAAGPSDDGSSDGEGPVAGDGTGVTDTGSGDAVAGEVNKADVEDAGSAAGDATDGGSDDDAMAGGETGADESAGDDADGSTGGDDASGDPVTDATEGASATHGTAAEDLSGQDGDDNTPLDALPNANVPGGEGDESSADGQDGSDAFPGDVSSGKADESTAGEVADEPSDGAVENPRLEGDEGGVVSSDPGDEGTSDYTDGEPVSEDVGDDIAADGSGTDVDGGSGENGQGDAADDGTSGDCADVSGPAAPEPEPLPEPVATAPQVLAADAMAAEDNAVPLDVAVFGDPSDTLSIQISGLPDGATLSAGEREPDGSWMLAAEDLAGLTLMPPGDFAGTINLTVSATATDGLDIAISEETMTVDISPVADAPTLDVAVERIETPAGSTSPIETSVIDQSLDLPAAIDGLARKEDVDTGKGDNVVHIKGDSAGFNRIDTDDGDDILNIEGAIGHHSRIDTDDGDDIVQIDGAIGEHTRIDTEDGADIVRIDGAIADHAKIDTGDGADTVQIIGALGEHSNVKTGDDDDVVSITGDLLGHNDIDLGSGDDVLRFDGAAGTHTKLDGGRGEDVLELSKGTDAYEINILHHSSHGMTLKMTDIETGEQIKVSDFETIVFGDGTVLGDAERLPESEADAVYSLRIDAASVDMDGSETTRVSISDLPDGATLNAGTTDGSGVWQLAADDLTDLQMTVPAGTAEDFTLRVSATTQEVADPEAMETTTLELEVIDGTGEAQSADPMPSLSLEDLALAQSAPADQHSSHEAPSGLEDFLGLEDLADLIAAAVNVPEIDLSVFNVFDLEIAGSEGSIDVMTFLPGSDAAA